MLVLSASGLWWLAVQLQRAGWLPGSRPALPPGLVHGTVMTFGFMPLFFAGFLFTAGPKWLRVPGETARALAPMQLLQCAGWLAWLAGGVVDRGLAGVGLLLALAGQVLVALRFRRMLRASSAPDRLHARILGAALAVGCAALAALGVSVALGLDAMAHACLLTGLWGSVAVVFVAAAHRLVPFLGSHAVPLVPVLGENWVLWLLLGVVGLEAVVPWLAMAAPALAGWQVLRAAIDLGAGAVIVALCAAWARVRSLRDRLAAMLHLGFLWWGLGLFLAGAAALVHVLDGTAVLPLAALHAFAMGGFGSLMLAMVTRVSRAHAGCAVVADDLTWTLFHGLQGAVVLRLIATVAWTQPLLAVSALAWTGVMVTWSARTIALNWRAPCRVRSVRGQDFRDAGGTSCRKGCKG